MPTLSSHDFNKLDGFIEDVKLILTGTVTIDDIHQAQTILAAVHHLLELGENPDGKYPLELIPGDVIELDTDQHVTVSGYSWKSNTGNQWTGDMVCVPVHGDPTLIVVPSDVRVAIR